MIQAVQGTVEKIWLTLQEYDLTLIDQPAGYPKISIYDETEFLVNDAVMVEYEPGVCYYNFNVPSDKIGNYNTRFKFMFDGQERNVYDTLEIWSAEGAIEPKNYNVAGV